MDQCNHDEREHGMKELVACIRVACKRVACKRVACIRVACKQVGDMVLVQVGDKARAQGSRVRVRVLAPVLGVGDEPFQV